LVLALLALQALATAPAAGGDLLPLYGGPTYDQTTGDGMQLPVIHTLPGSAVCDAGTAIGFAQKYVPGGSDKGERAVRWDASGAPATVLDDLGTTTYGWTHAWAYAINNGGTTVGAARKYDTAGVFKGERAVRWAASGTAATELGNLGTDASGNSGARAYAVNDVGTAAGYAWKYDAGTNLGSRAVRWDASGTVATELGVLGTDASGSTCADARDINASGTAVGWADKYDGGVDKGERAVRWAAPGTAATELGVLGTSAAGYTRAEAFAVNDAGTTVGYALKYDGDDAKGERAVRWDAPGTAATELGVLGTTSAGKTQARAFAVNAAGTAVGQVLKWEGGDDVGKRAVRWDASGTAATELGHLGTDSMGYTYTIAYDISDTGIAVGYARVDGMPGFEHAVVWGLDGAAVDLNDLIDPSSGWTLTVAVAISDDGQWVAGLGYYDPDGAGPLEDYKRLWLAQVPEPATSLLAASGLAVLTLLRRRGVERRR
jgi:hypothetical protein